MGLLAAIGGIGGIALGMLFVFGVARYFARAVIGLAALAAFIAVMMIEDKGGFRGTGDLFGTAIALGAIAGLLTIPLLPFATLHRDRDEKSEAGKKEKRTGLLDLPPKEERTLLRAAEKGDEQTVRQILDRNRETATDKDAMSKAIANAAIGGKTDLVELLLQKGGNLNSRAWEDMTPLFCVAAATDDGEMTKFLIDHGADTGAKTDEGLTALHVAVTEKHANIVKALLKSGAKRDVKATSGEYRGKTPADLAAVSRNAGIRHMFISEL